MAVIVTMMLVVMAMMVIMSVAGKVLDYLPSKLSA